jgi:hypothetical protein
MSLARPIRLRLAYVPDTSRYCVMGYADTSLLMHVIPAAGKPPGDPFHRGHAIICNCTFIACNTSDLPWQNG